MTGIHASPSRAVSAYTLDVNSEGQAQSVTLQLAALMLALLIPTALGVLFDERLTNGVNGWPADEVRSLARHPLRAGAAGRPHGTGSACPNLIRWSMLTAACSPRWRWPHHGAGRARRASHFSNATRLEVAYALMGLGAATIVILTFIAGLMLWRHPRPGVTRPCHRCGRRPDGAGDAVIADTIPDGTHGSTPSVTGALPLVGWSTTGGDLRPPFATRSVVRCLLSQGAPEGNSSVAGGSLPACAAFSSPYSCGTMDYRLFLAHARSRAACIDCLAPAVHGPDG
jgi:hypothetical protein